MSTTIPSVQDRILALRQLFPLLPLREARPLFEASGERGERVTPWIQYYVSDVNCDDTDRIAELLGTPSAVVGAQLEAFFDATSGGALLETRTVLDGVERVLDFAQFAGYQDDDGAPTAIWWTLLLPVLHPSLDAAYVGAQLGGTYGAETLRGTRED
ncbi:MAG: hypothetical protein HOO96_22675 [Polyangiaceae bacterium]|nr:hypothetical protein [Polyangiaceae bacterium]